MNGQGKQSKIIFQVLKKTVKKRLVIHYVKMQCNIYRIMLEPEAFLQSSGRRRLKSEFIIRLNAPFHCFRTSRSLLWPLKWNCRFLFVIKKDAALSF